MTLPSSGWIQVSDINVELGRAWNAPFDINEAAVRALAGKPSGAISFSDFFGKSAGITINLVGATYSDSGASGNCTISFGNDGTLKVNRVSLGNTTIASQWNTKSPTTITSTQASAYEILLTYVSGTNSNSGSSTAGFTTVSGTAYGSWVNLGTGASRGLSCSSGTNGLPRNASYTFNAQIRAVGTSTILANVNFTISAGADGTG